MRLLIPLFAPTSGTWGGLTRVLAIAEAAQQAGHTVAFCAAQSQKAIVEAHGYPVYDLPATTLLGLPGALSRRMEQRSQRADLPAFAATLFGSIWGILTLMGYARAGYLRRIVDAEMSAADRFKPDVLFTDLDLGAFLVAHITGLPIAFTYQGVVNSGSGSLPWNLIRRACAPVLRSHGCDPVTPDTLCFQLPVLKLIPSIPELDGTPPEDPGVQYVGSLVRAVKAESRDFTPEPGRRTVFVYVGTGSISLDVLESVLPQVFPAGSDTLCLVGAQSITEPKTLGNVRFQAYVPADAVIPHCDWVICHGGQNTIVQSLQNGVPLLIFPGKIFERRFNARKVEEAGAGLMGTGDDFTPEWLNAAMARRDEFAPQAAQLGQRIDSYGGAQTAVAALERLAAAHVT